MKRLKSFFKRGKYDFASSVNDASACMTVELPRYIMSVQYSHESQSINSVIDMARLSLKLAYGLVMASEKIRVPMIFNELEDKYNQGDASTINLDLWVKTICGYNSQ